VKIWSVAFSDFLYGLIIVAFGYVLYIFYQDEKERAALVDDQLLPDASHFAPLVAFVVAEVLLFSAVTFVLLVPKPFKQRVD